MFTGIVQSVGRVAAVFKQPEGTHLLIRTGEEVPFTFKPGDSVAVNGVCLTASEVLPGGFRCFAVPETLRLTTLGGLREGAAVNLEPAATPATSLGGHYVQGHVDGVAVLASIQDAVPDAGDGVRGAGGREMMVELPPEFLRYCVAKGSLALDGVSLTIASLEGPRLRFALVPHTLEHTTLGNAAPGDRLNFEVDLLAKYVERLLKARMHENGTATSGAGASLAEPSSAAKASPGRLSLDRLRQWGYAV